MKRKKTYSCRVGKKTCGVRHKTKSAQKKHTKRIRGK